MKAVVKAGLYGAVLILAFLAIHMGEVSPLAVAVIILSILSDSPDEVSDYDANLMIGGCTRRGKSTGLQTSCGRGDMANGRKGCNLS